SSLNVLSQGEVVEVLRRWCPSMAEGGVVVVEQLSREHFAAHGTHHVWWEGPTGSTDRTYVFDEAAGILEDRVVHTPPGGEPENLPVQRLHLPTATGLGALLETAGLESVEVIGSQGWDWRSPPSEAGSIESRRVLAFGRRGEG
ncbi:MAG: hypothetical protein ACYTDX_09040, partial [Planctomycetota bacterium]